MRFIDWETPRTDEIVEAAVGEFGTGRPLIVPTDTVYGLAGPVSSPAILDSIFGMKERPEGMTLPVAVGSLEMIGEVSVIDRRMRSELRRELPGRTTFVLPAKVGLPPSVVREGSIAVRIPGHPLFGPLCRKVGPLALTSANRHGRPPVTDPAGAEDQWGNVDILMICDGASITNVPSDIVDIRHDGHILLRKGKDN